MRRPLVRGIVIFVAGSVVIALAAAWSLGVFRNDRSWSIVLKARAFERANVKAEVAAAVADGDYRFVVIGGLATTYPGTIEDVAMRYGMRYAASTGLTP
jgi:hypothetical protein